MTIPLSASRLHVACVAVAALVLHSCSPEPACAATPLQLRWTAELSDPKPYNAVLFQGESADLVATLKLYGRAVALEDTATASLYYQTDGMGSAWWQSPATVTTAGVVTASWTPDMDAGADLYRWHLGVANAASSTIYRAFGAFRMQPSPGAAPNALAPPVRWIDFDLVAVSNPPWATPADVAEATEGMLVEESDPAWTAVSNAVMAGAAAGSTALQASWAATNGLPVAVAHAESPHGVTDLGGFRGGVGAVAGVGGALGTDAHAEDGGAIGTLARSVGGGAIGKYAISGDGFAGGAYAYATDDGSFSGSPIDAIQLGEGGNSGPRSLQVYSHKLMDAAGEIPMPRMAAVSNWVESIRGVHADIATNVVYHVVVSNGHWLIREVD